MKVKETTIYKIEMHPDDIAVLEDAKHILLEILNNHDIGKVFPIVSINATHTALNNLLAVVIENDDETAINNIAHDKHEEGYNEGYDDGHDNGYDEGYDEGHSDGYDEGYDDGKEAEQDNDNEEDDE